VTGSRGCGSVVTGSTWSSATAAVVGAVSSPPVVPPVRSVSGLPSLSCVTAKPSTGSPQATTVSPDAAGGAPVEGAPASLGCSGAVAPQATRAMLTAAESSARRAGCRDIRVPRQRCGQQHFGPLDNLCYAPVA